LQSRLADWVVGADDDPFHRFEVARGSPVIRLEDRQSDFGPVTIFRRRQTGALIYDQAGSRQSEADCNGVSLASYVHAIFDLLMQGKARDVLMIGCGGGTLGTMLARAKVMVTIVDVNPDAFTLAKRYFGLPAEIACQVADGGEFLLSEPCSYDAIILDAFEGDRIPSHLQSLAFFQRARRRLNRNGNVFANIHVADDQDNSPDRMAQSIANVWTEVRLLDSPGWTNRNAVIMAGNVARLRPPTLRVQPSELAEEIARELDTMQFRRCR
jgi:spermidine synthase